jgi:hypothetical protein
MTASENQRNSESGIPEMIPCAEIFHLRVAIFGKIGNVIDELTEKNE